MKPIIKSPIIERPITKRPITKSPIVGDPIIKRPIAERVQERESVCACLLVTDLLWADCSAGGGAWRIMELKTI